MSKKVIYGLLALCGVPFIGQLVLYPQLPEKVPIHWNANNEIDGWAGKGSVFLMALLPLLILALFIVVPKIDPKKESYKKHAGIYQTFSILMTVFTVAVSWLTPLTALGMEISVGLLINLGLGLIFMLLGNQMPRIRPNYMFGVRTPWTLASEVVWKKTHRFCGFVFVITGVMMMISGFFTGLASIAGIVLLLAGCVGSMVYSWWVYKQETDGSK